MAPWEEDWSEARRHEEAKCLSLLDKAHGMGPEEDFHLMRLKRLGACRELFSHMTENKDFWLQKFLPPVQLGEEWPPVDRACGALRFLSHYYCEKRKYNKAWAILELLEKVVERFRVLIFEDDSVEGIVPQWQKKMLRYRQHEFHNMRCSLACLMKKQEETVDSCRRCAELELLGLVKDDEKLGFIKSMKGISLPITIKKLQTQPSDEEIWCVLSSKSARKQAASHRNGVDMTKLCGICHQRGGLSLCSCGRAAYCCPRHQHCDWMQHKKYCQCPVCGTPGNTVELMQCSQCLQVAFCSPECQLK